MVSVNCKLSALQEVAKMLGAEVDGQELTIESAVLSSARDSFLEKKASGFHSQSIN